MKKLFNHTKKPTEDWKGYDENDCNWDEPAYDEEKYAEEDGYYIEEESGAYEEAEYYGEAEGAVESGAYEEAEYYGEAEGAVESGAYEEAEYYGETEGSEELGVYEEAEGTVELGVYEEAEGTVELGVYEEAEYYGEADRAVEPGAYEEAEYYGEGEGSVESGVYEEAEYYGEGEGFEEPGAYEEAEYYGEAEGSEAPGAYEEAEYYEEDQWEENGYGQAPRKSSRSRKGFFQKLQQGISAMSGMDKVILGTGVAVLVLALVTGSLYVSSRITDGQIADFASVGSQLDGIDVIGGQGLLAVADAEMARMAAAEVVQEQETEPPKDYQEAEYGREITVILNLTSVQKDLKIKFVNKSNGKLISNVPFAVTVTGPDGKSVVWSDDDMDGIIYKKDITPGNYTVVMEPFSDNQYSNYDISQASQKVEVKKDIEYKKVDVANEIKKESEINVAKEDTKQNVTEVESTLADTVEWVESKVLEAIYNEIPKSSVPDPAARVLARTSGILNQVVETVSGSDASPTPTVPEPTPTLTPDPTLTPTPSPTPTLTPTPSPTPSLTPTPTPVLKGLALDKSEVTILSTTTAAVKATLTGAAAAAPTVSAVSADTNVATVSVAGTEVKVTGVNAGSTVVTVSYTENKQTVSGSFTVTVKSHPKDDKLTPLTDADGKQLYVLVNDQYNKAFYADYYTYDKFYTMGDARYTGWQTLNGNVYYFNANGNKVTGEQVIQGAKYNFASDGSLVKGSGNMGIDVSKWNGNIDWTAVINSGVSYVIIRCGYRGSSEGKLIEDPKFAANIQGATAAGLKVGVYFFTQAVDEVEAVEEASMVLEQIRGYKISYPVFLDVEPSGGRADSIDNATRTAVCRAFCETIQRGGYTAGVYANKTWLTSKINASELSAYKIWLAQYAASPTYTGRYDLWQYKSTGRVSGIQGNVDMNLSYLGY